MKVMEEIIEDWNKRAAKAQKRLWGIPKKHFSKQVLTRKNNFLSKNPPNTLRRGKQTFRNQKPNLYNSYFSLQSTKISLKGEGLLFRIGECYFSRNFPLYLRRKPANIFYLTENSPSSISPRYFIKLLTEPFCNRRPMPNEFQGQKLLDFVIVHLSLFQFPYRMINFDSYYIIRFSYLLESQCALLLCITKVYRYWAK